MQILKYKNIEKGPEILSVCSMWQFMVIFLDFSSLFYI